MAGRDQNQGISPKISGKQVQEIQANPKQSRTTQGEHGEITQGTEAGMKVHKVTKIKEDTDVNTQGMAS